MTESIKNLIKQKSLRSIINPITGDVLDSTFYASSLSTTDLIDIAIEGGYQVEKDGMIIRIFKP